MTKKNAQADIIHAILHFTNTGATIREIEHKVNIERHTISKYLSIMESKGQLCHKNVGKAKLWFLNTAPLKTVLTRPLEKMMFSERVLATILELMPNCLCVIDREFNIIFMNKLMHNKYSNKEGTKFYESVLGLSHPLRLKKISQIFSGDHKSATLTIPDAHKNILQIWASELVNVDSTRSAIICMQDITSEKHAQDQILAQHMILDAERNALNRSAIVAETDLAGRITYVNDMFVMISGYSRDELIGKTHSIVNSKYHPKSFFTDMWKTIAGGKVWNGHIRNRKKNGEYYWVDTVIAPVLDKKNKPIKYISIRFDITKYKQS